MFLSVKKEKSGSKETATLIFLGALLCALTVVFIYLVAYDLLVNGPFEWHLTRSSAIEGGVEALLLTAVLCTATIWRNRWAIGFAVICALLYVRRHNAELTLLVGWLYWELLLALGHLFLNRAVKSKVDNSAAILAGIALWLIITFVLSMVNLAYPRVLLMVLCSLGVVSVLVNQRGLGVVTLCRNVRPDDAMQGALLGGGLAWLLVLAARSQNVIGHDTVWYLSRSDTLLAPMGSVFQNLNLVSPVHYFPKLWESLLLPVTAFDQLRLLEGVAIALLVIASAVAWQLCAKLSLSKFWRIIAAFLLFTIPAWANTALQIKSDVIATFFLLLMLLKLAPWFSERCVAGLLYAMAAAALAVSCKYTAIPYVFISMVFVLVEYWGRGNARLLQIDRPRFLASASVLVLAICVAVVLLVRTWLLTGVPTVGPDPLLKIWLWLGFTQQEPAGTLNWTRPQVWSDVPMLFYDWLWAPSNMNKIRISWQGNYWLLFLLVGGLSALLGMKGRPRALGSLGSLMLALCGLGLVVAVAWRYHFRGGDGNYYMYPLALATCLSLVCIATRLDHSACFRRVLTLVVLMFGIFHAGQSFIAAAWSTPGTRTFDWDLASSPLAGGDWRTRKLQRLGLYKISLYLESLPADARVVAHGFGQNASLLPVPTENLLSIKYARREYVSDVDNVALFLQRFDVEYLLLSSQPKLLKELPMLKELHHYAQSGQWDQVEGGGAILYKLPAQVAGLPR